MDVFFFIVLTDTTYLFVYLFVIFPHGTVPVIKIKDFKAVLVCTDKISRVVYQLNLTFLLPCFVMPNIIIDMPRGNCIHFP